MNRFTLVLIRKYQVLVSQHLYACWNFQYPEPIYNRCNVDALDLMGNKHIWGTF